MTLLEDIRRMAGIKPTIINETNIDELAKWLPKIANGSADKEKTFNTLTSRSNFTTTVDNSERLDQNGKPTLKMGGFTGSQKDWEMQLKQKVYNNMNQDPQLSQLSPADKNKVLFAVEDLFKEFLRRASRGVDKAVEQDSNEHNRLVNKSEEFRAKQQENRTRVNPIEFKGR